MANLTTSGIEITGLSGFRAALQERVRSYWGENVSFDPGTIQAQLIDTFAIQMAIEEEALIGTLNGLNIGTASGSQLDNWGNALGAIREAPTFTTVTGQLTGTAAAVIPAGSRASTAEGTIFELRSDVTLDAKGEGEGSFVAITIGALAVEADTLNTIVSSVSGWETVNNEDAGNIGRDIESDAHFRIRLVNILGQSQQGTEQSLLSRLLQEEAITHAKVLSNNAAMTATKSGLPVPGNSIMVIIRGGTDAVIAQALQDSVILGSLMAGSSSHALNGVTYKWQPVTDRRVSIALSITILTNYPVDGNRQIRRNLIEYFEANIGLGDSINVSALNRPIYNVPGHVLTSITVQWYIGQNKVPLVAANIDQIYRLADADIEITTTGTI